MALTLATELANYAAGIGTQGATLKIDSANKRVGVGTTNPQGPEGSLQVGTGITFFGNTGIISAIGGKFSGDFTVGGTLTYEDVQNVNSSGVGTFSGGINIVGGGLTVTGVSTFFSTVSIADSIVHTGDTNTSLRFPAADTFTVETGGSERLRVTSGGSVGIGSDDPQGVFDIFHATSNTILNVKSGDAGSVINVTDNSARSSIEQNGTTLKISSDTGAEFADSDIILQVDGSTKVRIDSSGRVGIGTNDLDDANSAADNLVIQDSANAGLTIRTGTTNYGSIYFADGFSGTPQNRGIVEYKHGDDYMAFWTSAQEAIRIDNTGNVAIGTIAPNVYSNYHALTINGDNGAEIDFERQGVLHADIFANSGAYHLTTRVNDLPIVFSTTDSGGTFAQRMRVSGTGLVGIGTDSPLDLLHITSASGDARVVIQGTVNNDSELKFYEGGTNKFTIGHDAASGEFRIGSVNVDTSVKLKINAAGDATFSGVTTATQLFEGTTRVASTGKAIAMAMLFG